MKILVLDAMGVIYKSSSIVGELLAPFILQNGGETGKENVKKAYLSASLGDISADQFWQQVGLDPELEDQYLSLHRISEGLKAFLVTANEMKIPVWMLSNDVDRWSRKLRCKFDIERYFQGAVISGDVRSRKPDVAIYQALFDRSGISPEQMLFFDDKQENVSTAMALGMPSILFDTTRGFSYLTGLLRDNCLEHLGV